MKGNILILTGRGIAGAVWGAVAGFLAFMLAVWLPIIPLLYYPLLFAGAVPLALIYTGRRMSLLQAVFAGVVSGLIYLVLSPVFPLFASILAGASLGGGLSNNAESPGDVLNLILNTLKGAVILPIVILTGSIVSGLINDAPLYQWLYWGFWTTVGITFIPGLCREVYKSVDENGITGALQGFRSEAKDISRELSELNNRIDL